MEWHESVFELINMRSFSNLWFWIALAVLWSSTSHWILGVPWDLIQRAGRQGGQAMEDLHDITRVNVNRILFISDMSGMWLAAITCFALTSAAILAFYYRIEFFQAIFLMGFPLSIVAALSIRRAAKIRRTEPTGKELVSQLRWHRVVIQAIALMAIFVTGMWGMYQLLTVDVLHS